MGGRAFAIVVSGMPRSPSLLLYRRAIRRGSVGTLAPGEIEPTLRLEDDADE